MPSRDDTRAPVAKRLSIWRRAVFLYGPGPAKKVALALAEFAWTFEGDPDGDIVVMHATQRALMHFCNYSSKRGLFKQLERLEAEGWITRDIEPTGRGVNRKYVLRFASSVPAWVLTELSSPSQGMWKRLLDSVSNGPDELQDTQTDGSAGDAVRETGQVNSGSSLPGSDELRGAIGCPDPPDRMNSGSTLSSSGEVHQKTEDICRSAAPTGDDVCRKHMGVETAKIAARRSPQQIVAAAERKRQGYEQHKANRDKIRRAIKQWPDKSAERILQLCGNTVTLEMVNEELRTDVRLGKT